MKLRYIKAFTAAMRKGYTDFGSYGGHNVYVIKIGWIGMFIVPWVVDKG